MRVTSELRDCATMASLWMRELFHFNHHQESWLISSSPLSDCPRMKMYLMSVTLPRASGLLRRTSIPVMTPVVHEGNGRFWVISRHRHSHGRRPLRAISGRIRGENRWLPLWAKADLLVQSCNAIGLQCLDDAIEDQTDTHCRDEEANNPGDGINPPRTQWRATS